MGSAAFGAAYAFEVRAYAIHVEVNDGLAEVNDDLAEANDDLVVYGELVEVNVEGPEIA